jgi:hypothetical protein
MASEAEAAWTNDAIWLHQLEAAYSQGYGDAYSEAYGTCEDCSSEPADPNAYYEYDESWFNPGEFE